MFEAGEVSCVCGHNQYVHLLEIAGQGCQVVGCACRCFCPVPVVDAVGVPVAAAASADLRADEYNDLRYGPGVRPPFRCRVRSPHGGDTVNEAEHLYEIAKHAQTAFWDALRHLEIEVGTELDSDADLSDTTLESLIQAAQAAQDRKAVTR